MPGVGRPTEAFAALANGASALKVFPAELLGPAVVKAWRGVFPRNVAFLPVGGITPGNMGPFMTAGADGFGLGSALFRSGMGAGKVAIQAAAFVTAWRELRPAHVFT